MSSAGAALAAVPELAPLVSWDTGWSAKIRWRRDAWARPPGSFAGCASGGLSALLLDCSALSGGGGGHGLSDNYTGSPPTPVDRPPSTVAADPPSR